ncbi:hypothetical protein [Micromonospora sp. WMMD812]|uniref:hypothetical protein n=1 Tax=Micromonospora sp. WMMD812 TaxID=3015152 RepID=UPI00248BBFCA|nr:hypothetical protein [Micromonospora sp. WMMD812]WBB68366.1 hypothetical protein O7603_03020 [Micromonospora sp. WMMD812]
MEPSMKDLQQLAVLDPARGREPSPMEWTRSEAFVERVIAGQATGTPARRPVGRRLVVGLAAATVGAVAVVTVPALLPGTAEEAVAAWTPAPGSLTGEQVLPQARICAGNDVGGRSSAVDPADVLLAEQRGLATLLIMRKSNGVVVECMSAGDDDLLASMGLADGPLPAPPAGTVDLQTMSSLGSGDAMWSNIVGLVGPGVTGVDVRLDNGKVFQASVKAGWWAAWWPGPEGGEVDHLTVIVHSASGKTTSYRPSELA